MTSNGTASLVFMDDVTADKSKKRMNCEVCTAILSAQVQPNALKLTG